MQENEEDECTPAPKEDEINSDGLKIGLQPALERLDSSMNQKIKPSIEQPQTLELKQLLAHLKYAFLEDKSQLPVIIATN